MSRASSRTGRMAFSCRRVELLIVCSIGVDALSQMRKSHLHQRISELLLAHRLGRTMVVFERGTCAWLKKNIPLSEHDRSTLNRIESGLAQTGALPSIAPKYIRVVPTGGTIYKNGDREVVMPMDCESFSEVILPPVLIVEDVAYDERVYSTIFTVREMRPAGHPVKFSASHGGGARTAPTDQAITQNRVVVSILDSDRVAPVQPPFQAAKFLSGLKDPEWPLLFVSELPCAELENVLPLEMYISCFFNTIGSATRLLLTIAEAEELALSPASERYWLFFDVKKGASRTEIESGPYEPEVKDWLRGKLCLSGLTAPDAEIGGFGKEAMKRLQEKTTFERELRGHVQTNRWREVFAGFFHGLYWLFIAARPEFVS